MRLAPVLLAALCLLGTALARREPSPDQLSPFRKDTEFTFQYNAQISSGLIAQSEEDSAEPQQKAATRIQAQAKISFSSDRHGQLRLQQIRFGQLNEGQLAQPQQVAPLSIFEPKQVPEQKQRQLQLPCAFSYADGVIERIQFHEQDSAWSKNIKRAVLNMIQLNLKRNNAQGLRSGDEVQNQQEDDEEQGQLSKLGKTFSIPEITLEGACQTTYTVNPNKCYQQECSNAQQFNVTKSIDFKKCQKIADVAFGFQTQQQQPQCAQCQQYYAEQQQKNGCQSEQCQEQQQQDGQHPCQKCDPKEVNENTLDRSTTLRYELVQMGNNQQQKYALKRTQLLSQYVFKQMKADSGKYGAAMHTIVSAELKLRSVQPKQEQTVPLGSSSKDESLMFSAEWTIDAKRFYMFGDEEFGKQGKQSPFAEVPKVQQAEQALRKLAQNMAGNQQNQQKTMEPQTGMQLQRLVDKLRMCTQQELRKIDQQVIQQGSQLNGQEKQKAQHIFCDALAICGTRNCVKELAEKIQKKEISQPKAVQTLKTLTQLPAPSDEIVKQVERLCKHESIQRQPALKQSCWLTFGALVNELCAHKTQKSQQNTVFGTQSGFDKQEQCPLDKKQQYKEAILAQFENAESLNQKIMALTALGNAGLDICVGDIERIVKDPRNARVVRVKAIDALRRLRTQMPRKIQQILLPIFQNNREAPEVRSAAFAILMYTLPEPQVLDQIMYTVSKCSNKQVQAFAYRTCKMMARSKNPVEQQIAKHIKNALKLANVDEQQLHNSGKWQLPVYSHEQQEGIFVTAAQMISPRSSLPAYAHIQLDSQLNDQFNQNGLKLFISQQEAEQWYQNVVRQISKSCPNCGVTHAQRRSSDIDNSQSLRDIYTSLGIQSRRQYSSPMDFDSEDQDQSSGSQRQQPFAYLCIRTNDVDHGFLPLDQWTIQNYMPQPVRQLLTGEGKPSLSRMLENSQAQQQIHAALAINLNEQQAKIPTSCGIPLRILSSTPVLASIDGQVKISSESAKLESPLGVQTQCNVHAKAAVVQIQKMECWTPFLVSGVESVRAIEANIPLNAELTVSAQQGVTLKVKLPRSQTTLIGAHSLPIVYTADVDPKSGLTREPRHVRAIHNPKLERMQKEADHIVGAKNLGIPLHIHGHYHWPSQPCNYQQFMQMLRATENVIHVTYQPNDETPREAVFRATGQSFQKSSGQQPSEMQNFYQKQMDTAFDSEELDELEMEQQSSRRQKLQSFLGQYNPKQQYKHSLKLSAQTVGGRKECKAQCEVQAQCDAKMQSCKVQIDAQRTPMVGESQKWTLKANAQVIMPETVQSLDEMEQLNGQKQNKMLAQCECQWGSDQKQQIRVKVQGEQAQKQQWRQLAKQSRQIQKRSAFLNKFDVQCEYNNLKPQTVNAAQRCMELAKSYYFWNSNSQLTPYGQQSGSQSNGQMVATIVIDPITQKHANVSVKTPTQQVRLTQIELPTQCRPFPLVRQQSQGMHSLSQFISQVQSDNRAECSVDGRRVDTFDDVEYQAPLSTQCYSVLAKDCSDEQQPQFVVLMKAIQSGINGQKKIKVITPEEKIECQPKQGTRNQRIQCKVNGQNVQEDDDSDSVQFNNAQKSDVTIHVSGVSVRFNGRKAWLKVSQLYKNAQCGLCGHYSDDQDDEWRMSNNQMAEGMEQFHRSYTLQSVDDEQCSQQEMDSFYQQHQNTFRRSQQQNSFYQQDSQEDQDNDDQEEEDWQNERFNGEFDNSDEQDYSNFYSENSQEQQQNQWNSKMPQQQTKVVEMSHEVCFSKQQVKQCPQGTFPVSRSQQQSTSEFGSNSEEEEDDEQQQNEDDQQGNIKRVEFVCMSRSSPETRRLLRQVRNGYQAEVSDRPTSFSEKVREPTQCQRRRY